MKRSGLTLLELAIVVVLIGILTAASLVGLQSAQLRTRNSRALSDLRTVAASLEMYATDHQGYPESESTYIGRLTTPIAYAGNKSTFRDQYPFRRLYALGYREEPAATVEYTNNNWVSPEADDNWRPYVAAVNDANQRHFGAFLLRAGGPSGNLQANTEEPHYGVTNLVPIPYDPTNGTSSRGHLLRAQKS